MIGKLFVQDFRSTRKAMLTVIGIVVLVGALSFAVAALRIPVLGDLGFGLGVGAVMVIIPLLLAMLVENYWRTMYGREGYFTMSIPVRGRTLFTSKLLYGFAVTLLGVVLTFVGIVAALAVFAVSQGGAFSLSRFWDSFGSFDPVFLWTIVGIVALQLVFWVVAGAAIMSIGAQGRFSHLGFGAPVLGGVILYFGMQIVGLAAMLFLPFGIAISGPDAGSFVARGMWQEFMAEFTGGDVASGGGSEPTVIGLGIVFVTVIATVVLAWMGARSVERRTSLR